MEPNLQIVASRDPDGEPPPHPEEMKARVEFRIGEWTTFTASARTTPAGLVSTGIMVAAILLSTAALVRAARR